MSRTRVRRPTHASAVYTKRAGIGRDRERWSPSQGTFRHDPPKEPFRARRAWARAQKRAA